MKSPEFGKQLINQTSPYLGGHKRQEINTSFYAGINTGTSAYDFIFNGNSGSFSPVFGNTQAVDVFKHKYFGGLKIGAGSRYTNGHSVPSFNVGLESNKWTVSAEFRGLKSK